jgi:hypothetical protein
MSLVRLILRVARPITHSAERLKFAKKFKTRWMVEDSPDPFELRIIPYAKQNDTWPKTSVGSFRNDLGVAMKNRASALFTGVLLLVSSGFAKDKNKPTIPPYVLRARTVAVIVDPTAGMSVDDPRANQVAQKDVETALLNWGRFEPVIGAPGTDLIIVIRKGHDRLVDQTIPDPRQNNRAGVINPTDNGISVGAQQGRQPNMSGAPPANQIPATSPSQTEIGTGDDTFTVYQGGVDNPLDAVPAWKYIAKDALHSHNVPAVDEFRKALIEADKAAAAKKP